MTTLVVDELLTTLSQTVNLKLNRRQEIEGMKVLIYMHNSPSGTFTLTLKKSGVEVASQTFDSAEIKSDMSTTDNYIWVWKGLTFANPFQIERGTYTIELSHSGYAYSHNSYLGWLKEWDNVYNVNENNPPSDLRNPLSLRFFERKAVNLT